LKYQTTHAVKRVGQDLPICHIESIQNDTLLNIGDIKITQ